LKEFMLYEKAIIHEDARIVVDLGASINTQLTEIVDVPTGTFELEQGKISLEKVGHRMQC
jgi:hypothetical protein